MINEGLIAEKFFRMSSVIALAKPSNKAEIISEDVSAKRIPLNK
jgi:hypothetical protein